MTVDRFVGPAKRTGRLVLAALVWVGCLAPTLPLPPPEAPTAYVGREEGWVRLESVGGAIPDAIVLVINPNEAVPPSDRVAGAQVDAEGSWQVEIRAASGDRLRITQESEGTRSDTLYFPIPRQLNP